MARERGRIEGLREALILIGVGLGVGLAKTLAPASREGRCDKLTGNRLGTIYGPCRLDANHDGDCRPESLFGKGTR